MQPQTPDTDMLLGPVTAAQTVVYLSITLYTSWSGGNDAYTNAWLPAHRGGLAMARSLVHSLRGLRIGQRITLMTGINVLVAVLLLSLAWLGMSRMEERLAAMERLREQSMRMETIAKKGLQLMLLARQFMDEGGDRTLSQLAVYATSLQRRILLEAEADPSLAPKTTQLLDKLEQFQKGFDQVYTLQQQLAAEYNNLLELSENIAGFLAIVSANARGESDYDLLPELEKASRWLHQAIAAVNRFYFSGEKFDEAQNELITLSIYLPALAERAGNSLRTNYLNQAAKLILDYVEGIERLAEGKLQRQELAANELNTPQNQIQDIISNILKLNNKRVHAGATALRNELERMTMLGLSLVAGLLLLSGLLSWAIGRSITQPLGTLHQAVRDQAEGRPVRSIPSRQGDDELAAMADTLRRVISLQAEKDALINELQLAQKQISQALGRIKNLLDNSGQGVVSFGPDLLVEREFSRECHALFQREDIAGQNVCELLCPHDPEARETLAHNLERICRQTDPFRRELLLSLMPGEFQIHDKIVEVQYRPLTESENQQQLRLMLLLTDVTRSRELQQAMQTEGRRLALVVAAVTNRDELLDVVDDLRAFLQDIADPAQQNSLTNLDIDKSMRLLHTYKGLFALMECIHMPLALHEAETRLSSLTKGADPESLARAIAPDLLEQALEQDLDVIRQTLGESFLESRGEVVLPQETTAALLQLAEALGRRFPTAEPREVAEGLELLRRLRHLDLRHMLERYPRMAMQIAERQDKELAPFAVEGEPVLVDPERLAPFVRSLVHVFRNAVDHGLESRQEREQAGKPLAGHMRCLVQTTPDSVAIIIEDDGRGIDQQALLDKAQEQGLTLDATQRENPAMLIFLQGLSTTPLSELESITPVGEADQTPLSGRGVGLAAVKTELEQIGGVATVSSEPGQGTRFEFRVPLPEPGTQADSKTQTAPGAQIGD